MIRCRPRVAHSLCSIAFLSNGIVITMIRARIVVWHTKIVKQDRNVCFACHKECKYDILFCTFYRLWRMSVRFSIFSKFIFSVIRIF